MKKIFISLVILCFMGNFLMASNAYDINYDDDNVKISIKGNTLIIKNNTLYHIVIDNIKINDRIVKNYLKIVNCNYIKYQTEVNVDYSGNDMQIFKLNLILNSKQTKKIKLNLKKGDEVRVEYYVVNNRFISDNIYLESKKISDTEKQYKLYPIDYIAKQQNLKGIMVYVTEYNMLIDNYEHPEIEVK